MGCPIWCSIRRPKHHSTRGAAPGAGEYGSDARGAAGRRPAGRRHVARWRPADPPVIAFAEPPSKTARAALKFVFRAADDYGVVAVRAIIRPVARVRTRLSVDLPLAARRRR